MGEQVDAMKAVSKAYRDRSLQEFQVRGWGGKTCGQVWTK